MSSSIYETLSSGKSGTYGKSLGNTLYGHNHTKNQPVLKSVPDGNVEIFLTRPYLNMSASNLRNDRVMTNLLNTNGDSIQNFIRHTLDPVLEFSEKTKCNLLDHDSAFMPVLSNTLKSISGFPDRILPTFSSKPGARQEQYSIPDGIIEINNKVDLTLTFDRMDGNVNERLTEIWFRTMSLHSDGILVPYAEFEGLTERNFDSRMYILKMDYTNRIVEGIAIANAMYPVNDNIGASYSVNNRRVNSDSEFGVRFEANGIDYNDPILLLEFNLVSAQFNNQVMKKLTGKSHNLFKIDKRDEDLYANRGTPLINLETMELEWWVDSDTPTVF